MWMQNDLTDRQLKVRSNDEVGLLRDAFNKMLADRRKTIVSINVSSEAMADKSGGLSSAARQAALATQEIVGTISGLAATVEEQSASTAQVRNSAGSVSEMARKGKVEIDRVLESMGKIAEKVVENAEVVRRLEGESHRIEQIIATVSGIADQTNLLALNATIEAARAGEAGRGFTVVAEEVRKLAQQSADAARSIEVIITTIRTETDKAVTSMGEISEEVRRGVAVSGVASQSFADIVKNLDQVAAVFADIDQGIANVSVAAQGLAASSEQLTATIQQVSNSADLLNLIANKYKAGTSVYKM